ncbi:MAG: hypothetical protein ABI947_27950 [Chloroflexota bacterium]
MFRRPTLSIRRQRQLAGCYYLGCFTPLAFAFLAVAIVVKAIGDKLRIEIFAICERSS